MLTTIRLGNANFRHLQAAQTMQMYQMTSFQQMHIRKQLRINRKLKQMRQERIQKESSFNKNEILDLFSNKAAAAAVFSSDLDFEQDGPQKTSWTEKEVFPYLRNVSKERKF
jgi:hypothetical protein